ncbi:hypothetical protein AAC387_Pa05g1955 [Persea americana]
MGRSQIKKEGKPVMILLVTIACLFIATKIEKTAIPKSHDLQVGNEHLYFEARAIQRMELLMLNILKWRMQPITPFSLIHHILKKGWLKFFEFRPFEVAVVLTISVTKESEAVNFENVVSHCLFVDKVVCFNSFGETMFIFKCNRYE